MKEKRYGSSLFIVLSLIVTISVVATAIAGSPQVMDTWHNAAVDAVDLGYYVHYSYTDVLVDSAGNTHVVYRGPSSSLRYATSDNNCWSTEVVLDTGLAVARESAIALDANGLPHISFSYRDGSGENLMYSTQDITDTWRVETVYTPGSVGMENDIAVDSNGFVHIVHWRWNGSDILYSTNLSGTWATEVITLDAVGWRKTTIGIDSNDHLHIAYSHFGDLVYTNNITGTWDFTTIDSAGENPNIAIDANDKVHISYDSGNDLNYATNISGTWAITTAVTGVNPGRDHAIAVDVNNNVYISYHDATADHLKSVNNVSGSWVTDTVDSQVGAGRSNSIDIDDSGIVHISYRYDSGAWPILYGVWSDPTSNEVFAVGALGTIVHYDGNTWQEMDSDMGGNFFGVWGFSNSDVYAVGSYGHIYRYDGSSWLLMDSPTAGPWRAIWGSSPSDIYVVGELGTIQHYDGNVWNPVNLGITTNLRGVWGSSASDIFVVGYDGAIWHFDGNVWTDMTYPVLNDLNDVWGSLANDVFAVGNGGLILHYDGNMWSQMVSNTTANLTGVWGTSSTNVYAVGSNGTIRHYDGNNWNIVDSVSYHLYDIWGNSASSIFAPSLISVNNSGTVIGYYGTAWEPVAIARLRYANNASTIPTCMPYLVTLEPDGSSAGDVGTMVPYTLTLTNEGVVSDTFDLSATAAWATTLSPTAVTLESNESTSVYISVAVPAGATNGEVDVASIMAVSQGDPVISDTASLTTTAVVPYALTLEPDMISGCACEGKAITYTLTLTNAGNMTDTYYLNMTGNEWQTTISPISVTLGAKDKISVYVSVQPPEDIPTTACVVDTTRITAVSQNDTMVDDTSITRTTVNECVFLPLIKKD